MATLDALAKVPFLVDLSVEEMDELARCLRRRRFRKGEVIFVQGDPGSSLYLIEAGQVKISLASPEGREMTLALRGPGDFFGELSLLDGEPRSADTTFESEIPASLKSVCSRSDASPHDPRGKHSSPGVRR